MKCTICGRELVYEFEINDQICETCTLDIKYRLFKEKEEPKGVTGGHGSHHRLGPPDLR